MGISTFQEILRFQISSIQWLPNVLGNMFLLLFTKYRFYFSYIKNTPLLYWCQPKVQCSHYLQLKVIIWVIDSYFFFQIFLSLNFWILSIPFLSVYKLPNSDLCTWISCKIYLKAKVKAKVHYPTISLRVIHSGYCLPSHCR